MDIKERNWRSFGKLYCFFYSKRGVPRIIIGPHWPFTICLLVSVIFIVFLNAKACYEVVKYGESWIWVAIDAAIVLVGLLSFFYTLLANPGIPEEIFRRDYDTEFVKEETKNR